MPTAPRVTLSTALVLHALGQGVRYGFDIIDATGLPSGTVYPILRRLEQAGLARATWERIDTAREEQRPPRRYYRLTGAGTALLREARDRFPAIAAALGRAATA